MHVKKKIRKRGREEERAAERENEEGRNNVRKERPAVKFACKHQQATMQQTPQAVAPEVKQR